MSGYNTAAAGVLNNLTTDQNLIGQWNSFQNFQRQSQAQMMQENASTNNQIAQTLAQTSAEKRKTSAQIHQINMETQTKVSEMNRETYINRRKSSDKLHESVKKLMMS